MAELSITLVGRTNDVRDDGCRHAVLHVPQSFAQYLANFHEVYKALARKVNGVYCIEIWNGACDWGTVKGLERGREQEWFVTTPDKIAFTEEARVECETAKVMDDGVLFSATYKNDDPPAYFESPTLSWTDVERMAKAPTEAVMMGPMESAVIDYSDPEELKEGGSDGEDEEEAG